MIKSERQKLLVLLQDYINDITSSDLFSNEAFAKKFPVDYIDLPELILKIMWVKETIKKVRKSSQFLREDNMISSIKKFLLG